MMKCIIGNLECPRCGHKWIDEIWLDDTDSINEKIIEICGCIQCVGNEMQEIENGGI